MKVLLLSDSHGALDERIAVLSAECDYAVHAGDVGSAEVLAALVPRRAVLAVRGNNDTAAKWAATGHRQLERLPDETVLLLPGGALQVVHGHRHGAPAVRHARLRREWPQARCIVYGHSHRLVCDTCGAPWVVNPGACGRSRTHGGASCVLLEATPTAWRLEIVRFGPGRVVSGNG